MFFLPFKREPKNYPKCAETMQEIFSQFIVHFCFVFAQWPVVSTSLLCLWPYQREPTNCPELCRITMKHLLMLPWELNRSELHFAYFILSTVMPSAPLGFCHATLYSVLIDCFFIVDRLVTHDPIYQLLTGNFNLPLYVFIITRTSLCVFHSLHDWLLTIQSTNF
jgi:hypothetical protein